MPSAGRKRWMEAWEGDLIPSEAAQRSAARTAARVTASGYYGREATARLPQPALEITEDKALVEVKVASSTRPRWGMTLLAITCAGLFLAAALICPMLFSSAATQMEAAVGRLEAKERELGADVGTLTAQIAALSSLDRVAREANDLGLETAASVRYFQPYGDPSIAEGETTIADR